MKFEEIQIEVTSKCNLRCPFCPEGKLDRPQGTMPLATAGEILAEASALQLSDTLVFHVLGEPLLHPRIADLVRIGSENFKYTHLYTNMTLLTPARFEGILNAGLTHLHLSIQSHDEASYRSKFPGTVVGSFESAIESVKMAIRTKVQTGLPSSELRIKHVHNIGGEWFDRAKALGSESLAGTIRTKADVLRLLEIYCDAAGPGSSSYRAESIHLLDRWNETRMLEMEIYPGISLLLRPVDSWGNNMSKHVAHKLPFGKCRPMARLETLAISWDGRVTLCCFDPDFKNELGKITPEKNLMSILSSDQTKRFIQERRRGVLRSEQCKTCMGSYSLPRALTRNLTSMIRPVNPDNNY